MKYRVKVLALSGLVVLGGSGIVYAIANTLIKQNLDWNNGISLNDIRINTNLSGYYLVFDKTMLLPQIDDETLPSTSGLSFGLVFKNNLWTPSTHSNYVPTITIRTWNTNGSDKKPYFSYISEYKSFDVPDPSSDQVFYWGKTTLGYGPWTADDYFQIPPNSRVLSISVQDYAPNSKEKAFWDFIHAQKIYKTLPADNEI